MDTTAIRRTNWMTRLGLLTLGLLVAVCASSVTLTSARAGSLTPILLTPMTQGLTAAEKAEKKAKRKAKKEQQKTQKKKQQNKNGKNQEVNKKHKNEEQKKKKTQEEKKELDKETNSDKNIVDKKKNKKNKETTKKHKEFSGDERKSDRKRRAKHARKVKDHNVWYSKRRAVWYRGKQHHVRSRRVLVTGVRYRNRYRSGFSIYYLPPAGAAIALGAYAVSAAVARPHDIYVTLYAPPVMPVSRRYSIDEVVENPEVRQLVRSVDLDINFETGSAEIPEGELASIDAVAKAMLQVLEEDPEAKFLVEGHTDATGDPDDNLLLSEDRAATVVGILEAEYGIPDDNLEAVGYGSQYLKEDTAGPSRTNRRVVVRNISGVLEKN